MRDLRYEKHNELGLESDSGLTKETLKSFNFTFLAKSQYRCVLSTHLYNTSAQALSSSLVWSPQDLGQR